MAGLLDWITDGGLSSSVFGGGLGAQIPGPADSPMQQTGMDQAAPPSAAAMPPPPLDPSTSPNPAAGFGGAASPPNPVPLPQPRPDGAPGPMPGANPGMPPGAIPPPPPPTPTPGPAGPPTSLAPPAPGPDTAAPNGAQGFLGRALGINPQQGQQIGSGLAAGLKSVGDNWNKPGLAAFSGSAGSAMEGSQKQAETQQTQMAKYLDSAIKSRQAGDEAGYKQNYLKYLAAKLQADTDKAANKDAGANKNDTPTQLYLSAQRLVQPDRKDMNTQLSQMRKDGADPAEIAKKQTELETAINAKLADHFATLGINPQTASQLAQQPGNSDKNPIDAGKLGITKDNIGQKLHPGQYYTNPSDGKLYQYKGSGKAEKQSVKGVPDKPTTPEPANPMNKREMSAGKTAAAAADDED